MKKIVYIACALLLSALAPTACKSSGSGTDAPETDSLASKADSLDPDSFVVCGICYRIISDSAAEVTRAVADYEFYSGNAAIPERVEFDGRTYKVASIGEGAFRECETLTLVTVPDRYEASFYGLSEIKSVTIPEGVTSIGVSAFWGCTSLMSVVIPDSVDSIGEWAFYGCEKLRDLTLGSGTTVIGKCAFMDCSSLCSAAIPEGVIYFGLQAFDRCDALSMVSMTKSDRPVGEDSFRDLFNRHVREIKKLDKNLPQKLVNAYAGIASLPNVHRYFLFDITGNGIPELWTIKGTCEQDFHYVVHTVAEDSIKVIPIKSSDYDYASGEYHDYYSVGGPAWHADFYQGKGYLIRTCWNWVDTHWYKITYGEGCLQEEDAGGTYPSMGEKYTEPSEKPVNVIM